MINNISTQKENEGLNPSSLNLQEEDIKQNYKWFCDSCNKRKEKPISYTQFKKEFLEMKVRTNTPEEQRRLKLMSEQLKTAQELLNSIPKDTDTLLSDTIKGKFKRLINTNYLKGGLK